MNCNRLHACWSTQSRLATLLSFLIARWPDVVSVVGSIGVKLLDFFYSGIQLCILLSPYLGLSPFYTR